VSRYTPAAFGVAGIVACAALADVWAWRTGRPGISAAVAEISEHPLGGPVVAGALAALVHHLAIDPILRRLT
jgi:hypothetical protein